MLVLTRKPTESIIIGKDIVVQVISVSGLNVRLAISAPKEVLILREELLPKEENAKQ